MTILSTSFHLYVWVRSVYVGEYPEMSPSLPKNGARLSPRDSANTSSAGDVVAGLQHRATYRPRTASRG